MLTFISLYILLVIFLVSRMITGRFFSPPAIFPIQWFFLIIIALISGFRYIDKAVPIILTFNLLFCLGFYSYYLLTFHRKKEEHCKFSRSLFSYCLWISQIIAVTGSIMYINIVIHQAGSIMKLFIIGGVLRQELIEGGFSIPLYIRIMSYFSLPNLILSIIYKIQFKSNYFIYISIFSIIVVSIAGMGRLNIILSCIFAFWSLYYGLYLLKDFNINRIEKKLLVVSFMFLLIIVISFVGILRLRIGGQGEIKNYFSLLDNIPLYTAGSISAFGKFVKDNPEKELLFGQRMFSGVFDILGISERKVGLYRTWVKISKSGKVGNVYTAFRIFLEDFGFPGFLIISYLAGFLSGIIDRKIVYGKNILYFASAVYVFTIISMFFITSLTVYNSIILGIIYLNLFLYIQIKHRNIVLRLVAK